MELLSPKVEYYSSGDNKGKPTTNSVIGYMTPYTEELWKSWMKQFTLQTECQFTIRTGVQENQNTSRESGVIKFQQSVHSYKSVWTHTYVCLRGGKGRLKSLKLSKKNRRAIGTRRLGCEAAICLRLLKMSNGTEILEIKVPMNSAHSHDVSSVADQICLKPLQQIEAKVSELVQDSLLNQRALRMALKTWVNNELIPLHLETGVIDKEPSLFNRAYCPNAEDVRIMVKKAIIQERNSQFDQGAVLHLLREEKDKNQLNFFFREYKMASNKYTSSDEKDNSGNNDSSTSSSQRDNLRERDNTISSGEEGKSILLGEESKAIEKSDALVEDKKCITYGEQ